MKSKIAALGLGAALLLLGGCATGPAPTHASNGGTAIGNARFSSKMYSSIFLQPVPPNQKVVFVSGHNTSSAQNLHFLQLIESDLMRKGYTITQNPDKAEYMLMYNILYVGRTSDNETLAGAVAGGFGAAVLASAAGGGPGETAGSGIVGAALGGFLGHYLSPQKFVMVVDIQVEQRNANAQTSTGSMVSEGLGNTTYSTSGFSGWQIYRDRVASMAEGIRLHFPYVEPALCKVMAGEISGIF